MDPIIKSSIIGSTIIIIIIIWMYRHSIIDVFPLHELDQLISPSKWDILGPIRYYTT